MSRKIDQCNADMAQDALAAIQELLDQGGIPRGTFADEQVQNLVALYNQRGDEIERLRAVVVEWLPIVQRQLDGLLRAAEAQDGAKSLFESVAWKAANERVDRMRTALESGSPKATTPEVPGE